MIIKNIEEAENISETSDIYDITQSKETYRWDGKKATLIKKQQFKKVRKALN